MKVMPCGQKYNSTVRSQLAVLNNNGPAFEPHNDWFDNDWQGQQHIPEKVTPIKQNVQLLREAAAAAKDYWSFFEKKLVENKAVLPLTNLNYMIILKM